MLWDLGGQIKMRSMWEKYYDEAHAIIFVVDSADVARLEEAKLAYGKSVISRSAFFDCPRLILVDHCSNALPLNISCRDSLRSRQCDQHAYFHTS